MPSADTGNPNFFKTFLGRFEAVLPDGGKTPVMLTAMNEVCLMQDLTADSDGLIMTLPEQCRPKNPVRFACVVEKPASRSTLVTVSRQVGTVKGASKTGSVKINNPGKASTGMTATQYDGYSTSDVEVPILRVVDIPVMENVSLDLEAGNIPETVVTVNPDGNVTGIPGAMHRLNGRAFYVIDRYYL